MQGQRKYIKVSSEPKTDVHEKPAPVGALKFGPNRPLTKPDPVLDALTEIREDEAL